MPAASDTVPRDTTNPTIFLRLNRKDTAAREIAWREFRDRYAPVIARFARNLGCHPQDIDDVLQEVLTGFFAKSPTFVYDPLKGRFRGYLKTCTCNVLRDRAAKDARFRELALPRIDPDSIQIEQTWNDLWEQQLLQRAVDAVRSDMSTSRSFAAFEQYVILDRPAQGSEFRVSAGNYPSGAMDADGDFVITWSSQNDGSNSGVYAKRYNASGEPQGSEFRVNTYTTNQQEFPDVAMDADGDFVVAWRGAGEGDTGGVFAQRYNVSGVPEGTEFRVNTYTTSRQQMATIAMDADGDFVIAWVSTNQDGSGYGVYAQRFDASGVPQGSEFRVNTYTPNWQWIPSVAMGADGGFVITWESEVQDGSDFGVYAQRYDASGVPQGSEFRVNTYTTNWQRSPSVAMGSDGNFVIAWNSSGQDGSAHGVYAQRYDAFGVPLGVEFRVNSYTPGTQSSPSVAMDADGNFVIIWTSSGQDGSYGGVYAQRYEIVPEVLQSHFAFNTAPHRIQYQFDGNVAASLGTDDLIVQNLTSGQIIPASEFSVAFNPAQATFTYTGSGGGISGVLPDGNYRATLLGAGISTPRGHTIPADHVLDFFFLNGDANRDGSVTLNDFNILAGNFGTSGRDFTQGNFDYDPAGNVNLNDFNLLAARFGVVLRAAFAGRTLSGGEQGSWKQSADDRVADEVLASEEE